MTENEVTEPQASVIEQAEPVKTKPGLFRRIFGWKKIDAEHQAELAKLDAEHQEAMAQQDAAHKAEVAEIVAADTKTINEKDSQIAEKESQIADKNSKIAANESQIADLEAKLEAEGEKCTQLTETNTVLSQRVSEEDAKIEQAECTWKNHVADVSEQLADIAQKNDLIKILTEDYQYAGSPQNVFLFSKMYTIFDAIAPANQEDLPNFSKEVREYAESMKKYYKAEVVRSDIYLVVPTTASTALDQLTFSFKAYTVHVITPEAMPSILLMLKELEAYDYSSQIATENQEKICQILARLSITAKKKVQLDALYSKEMVAALKEINTLPGDCTSEILQFEERNKLLAIEALSSDVEEMQRTYIDYSTGKQD